MRLSAFSLKFAEHYLHISTQALFRRLCQIPTRPLFLKLHVWCTENGFLQLSNVRGGSRRGGSRCHRKESLKYSLDRSFPYWDLDIMIIHPPPLKAYPIFRLDLLPTVSFGDLTPPYSLSIFLPRPASHPSFT